MPKTRDVLSTAGRLPFSANDGGTHFRYAPDRNAGTARTAGGTGDPRAGRPAVTGSRTTWAFIVLNAHVVRRVGDVVGANGIAFNGP